MRILELETSGVRGLRDGAYRFDPSQGGSGHVTVVTGPPQCGLTSFLDAIAFSAARLAASGLVPTADEVLSSGGEAATLRSTWWLDADERAYGGLLEETTAAEVVFQRGDLGRADADPALLGLMSRYDHSASVSKVVSIPAGRITDGVFPAFSDFEADQKYKRFSRSPEKFAAVPHALVKDALGMGDFARFQDAHRLFRELCDSVLLIGATGTGQLNFVRTTGAHVPLAQLSFTERNALVLAAVPALLGLQRSVILLDTPELGLAPGVAARWLGALRAYAPEAQWIVASRDPAVVASVEPAARIELSRGAS